MRHRLVPYIVTALAFVLGYGFCWFSSGPRHADCLEVALADSRGERIARSYVYDGTGTLISTADHNLDDPISTLWDY